MEDLQLALIVARLFDTLLDDTMPASVISLLNVECLGRDPDGLNYDPAKAHPDPFVRSMAAWLLKEYHFALSTLLDVGIGSNHRTTRKLLEAGGTFDTSAVVSPSVFNFYNYLRKHPLLLRQHLAAATASGQASQSTFIPGFTRRAPQSAHAVAGGATGSTMAAMDSSDNALTFVDCITPVERRLYFTTAASHFSNGCPALALEVLAQLPPLVDLDGDLSKSNSDANMSKSHMDTAAVRIEVKSPTSPKAAATASALMDDGGLDWGSPMRKFEDEPLVLTFDDDDNKNDIDADSDDGKDKGTSKGDKTSEVVEIGGLKTQLSEEGTTIRRITNDIMAQQLKFVACLRIMMVELSTLATGFEVDGGQLRYQLFVWLENAVEVLHRLCQYASDTDPDLLRGFTGGRGEL